MPGELTESHIDSVGLSCPGARIVAMDPDGHELPRGEIGELWIQSASVIKGYWNNPKATAESFTSGFWHSGDLGSVDAEGFVRVFDRQKDMQAERGDGGGVGVTVDAEDAAFLAQRVPLQIVLNLERGRPGAGVWIEIELGVLVRVSHLVRASL